LKIPLTILNILSN